MREKYEVSVIIVNWNGLRYLKNCLASLLNIHKGILFEIIIVDNGSSDGSQAFVTQIKKRYKHIKLIENKKNLGFAEANNIGFTSATGELILFLNNDTVVDPKFLNILVSNIKKEKKVAAVQPKILMMDDRTIVDSAGSFFTNTGILFHRGHKQKDKKLFNVKDEIFSMKGACMLIRKTILKNVGLFDRDYFAYFEETDLCHRILLAGYSILYVPESMIYHKGGGTTGKVGSAFIQFHSFKNRIMSYLTNFETVTLVKIMPLHIIICLLSLVGFLLIRKPAYSLSIIKALFWNVQNFRLVLKKRKHVQSKIRILKDSEYLPRITKDVTVKYYYYLFAGKLNKYHEKT